MIEQYTEEIYKIYEEKIKPTGIILQSVEPDNEGELKFNLKSEADEINWTITTEFLENPAPGGNYYAGAFYMLNYAYKELTGKSLIDQV